MYSQMGQQMMLKRKAFLALAALIRALGGVQQQMSVQTVLVGEVFSAMRADVWTFT